MKQLSHNSRERSKALAGSVHNNRLVRIFLLVTSLTAILLIASCSTQNSRIYKTSRVLMGTFVEITISGQGKNAPSAAEAIFEEIKRVENLTSFHKNSGLTEI